MKKYILILMILVFIGIFHHLYNTPTSQKKLDDKALTVGKATTIDEQYFFEPLSNLPINNDIDKNDYFCEKYLYKLSISKGKINEVTNAIIEIIVSNYIKYGDDKVIDFSSLLSGVGVNKSRAIRYDNVKLFSNFQTLSNRLPTATPKSMYLLNQKFNNASLKSLTSEIKKKSLEKNALYLSNGKLKTLLSYIIERYHSSAEFDIDILIDLNFDITEFDLKVATSNNLPKLHLEKLYNASTVDANFIFTDNLVYESLATVALKSGSYENTIFWKNYGSSLTPDIFNLKLLTSLEEIYPPNEIKNILRESLSETFSFNEYTRLITKYNFSEFDLKNITIIDSLDSVLDEKQIIQSHEIKNDVFSYLVNTLLPKFDTKNKCFEPLGKRLAEYVFSNYKSKPNIVEKHANLYTNKDFSSEIFEAELKYDDSKIIEQTLSALGDLEGKRAVHQYRKTVRKKLVEGIEKEIEENDELKALSYIIEEAIKLAQKGLWSEAIQLLNNSGLEDNTAYDTLIYIALSHKAPIEVMLDLLEKGATLPLDSNRILIATNNVKAAEALLEHGLNLGFSQAPLFEPITFAVSVESLEMLKFLLSNGVSVPKIELGFDPLLIVLDNFNISFSEPEYIEVLLFAGNPVNHSHYKMVEEMKSIDPISYQYISNYFPELIY
ncbi:hypothetical protein OE749_02300 [Aestuariibacter sp. AA17]|uniref:Ankyrin repeats (3 copies) n=1 Tax=Fluctibacter corallii TaxID=2984329 RepID=A0ABT3A4C4_9ALTE|nr:hypothetical protein [Aestuariibacter sp. AA17]MCV2883529.1 hypothetical protein [Aestuariibacter sp. AA17]